MREPRFWSADLDPRSREAAPLMRFLLSPFASLYAWVTKRRISKITPHKVSAKVICVGNLTAGGVGKSPIVAELRATIEDKYGLRVATLSRGYKGRLKGPLKVVKDLHTAKDVGDEPLMLSTLGEAWIGADRKATGQAMAQEGVEVIIMDDGHQNPTLSKDFTFIVVDAKAVFGNGFVIPKGPLREPVHRGLSRADAIILMGEGALPEALSTTQLPILRAGLVAKNSLAPLPYVAFAGIGRPEKFFASLEVAGADVRDSVPFPDHHAFTGADWNYLQRLASDHQAQLITTQKDYARLDAEQRESVHVFPVKVQFEKEADLDKMIADVINKA